LTARRRKAFTTCTGTASTAGTITRRLRRPARWALVRIKPPGCQMVPAPPPWYPFWIWTRLRRTPATTPTNSALSSCNSSDNFAPRLDPSLLVPSRPLVDDEGQLLHLPAAHDAQRDGTANSIPAQQRGQIVHAGHRLVVQADDGITEEQACPLSRTPGLDRDQEQAGFVPSSLSHRGRQAHTLSAYAQVTPAHPPTGQQRFDNAAHRRQRQGQADTLQQGRRADRPPRQAPADHP